MPGLRRVAISKTQVGQFYAIRVGQYVALSASRVEVTSAEIAAILEGIDLSRARRLPRFSLPVSQPA